LTIQQTDFDGLILIEQKVFEDSRGWFSEAYNKRSFEDVGINIHFVQDNHSCSKKNVIRGLHFQTGIRAQTKLVRVLSGTILDVVVDLRRSSATFKRTYSVELSGENKKQLIVPKGFAHGFSVLSDVAEVLYKTDEFFYPECDGGILYNDPEFAIDWRIKPGEEVVSAKDKALPLFRDVQPFD
jgi:dTDP-4-dehydrorhamnose 3,5-epimerase